MNNFDKAREPSMDEILASIRKIIAEEPSDARTDAEATPSPLLTGTALPNERSDKPFQMNDRPRPSLDRLSSALKARATTPPAPPLAGKRPVPFSVEPPPSSFVDDLADLLDAPLPAHPFVNDRPKLSPLANLTGKDDADPIAAPVGEVRGIIIDADVETLLAGEQADAPSTAASDHAVMNGEPASAASPAADGVENYPPPPQPRPAPVSPWDAMRKKSGYWPPQGATVSSPAPGSSGASATSATGAVNGVYAPGSGPFPSKEAQQALNSSAPPTTADLVARLHAGLTETASTPEPELPSHIQFSVPPGASAAPPMPPYPAPPAPHLNGTHTNEPRTNGTGYSPVPPPPNNFVPPYSAAPAPDPAPIPQAPAADPYARPLSTDALMNAALASLMNGNAPPLNLDPFVRQQPQADASRYQPPYGQSNYSTNNYSANPYASYEPDPSVAAAAAFDALAQGLAASSRLEPRRTYDYQQPAAPTPRHTALVAQPLLPAVQEVHPQAIRTLEDAVAEMLKPLLQRWLSDNMPRIIERALRFEAASGVKSPGSQ